MDTEAAFQSALDADPTDAELRMVFADFLDEIGDPRGPGYRVMGKIGLRPMLVSGWCFWNVKAYEGYEFGRPARGPFDCAASMLHHKWFMKTARGNSNMLLSLDTRRATEDDVAKSWSCLSPAEQAEILSQSEVPA